MEDKIKNLLSYCSGIDFGAINLSDREKEFYKELNNEIILFCKSLPESIQTDAIIFSMRYSGISFGEDLNFFRNFIVPAWSIIYWLTQSCPTNNKLTEKYIKNAITAHSMALFLHSLDDHLNDGEMPASHLALLLRSEAWMKMTAAHNVLADSVDGGEEIARDFIDDYYASIRSSEEIKSLDSYCDLFKKQMATGMIVPVLMIQKMTRDVEFVNDIQAAYGSFGIAWRLLDDINDVEIDMLKSLHSSIYVCLTENIKSHWDKLAEEESNKESDNFKIIVDYLIDNGIIDRIKTRICSELEAAASIADAYKIVGLADEFRCLSRPLQNGPAPL